MPEMMVRAGIACSGQKKGSSRWQRVAMRRPRSCRLAFQSIDAGPDDICDGVSRRFGCARKAVNAGFSRSSNSTIQRYEISRQASIGTPMEQTSELSVECLPQVAEGNRSQGHDLISGPIINVEVVTVDQGPAGEHDIPEKAMDFVWLGRLK